MASAREGSFPAKTESGASEGQAQVRLKWNRTMILTLLFVGCVLRDIKHHSFDRNPCGLFWIRSYHTSAVSVSCLYLGRLNRRERSGLHTVALTQLFQGDFILFGGVELDWNLRLESFIF